jgi:hypothetical protein
VAPSGTSGRVIRKIPVRRSQEVHASGADPDSGRQRTSPVQDTTERDGDQTMPGTALWDTLQGCDRATPRAKWWKPYLSMANRLEWFPLDFIITTALNHAGPLDYSFRVGYLWVKGSSS